MSRAALNVVEVKLKEDPLRTKYSITRENEKIKVVLTLEALKNVTQRLPIRYALAVDVSGSMDNTIGNDTRSLLERMKHYMRKLIDRVGEEDSVAVISFSSRAKLELPMTQMKSHEKDRAKGLVQNLVTDGMTNIWDGLEMALNEIHRTSSPDAPGSRCQDCIILFTDGIANEGPTDSNEVVSLYQTCQKTMKRKSGVPVSAISIGSAQNDLLQSIAEHLGFEASYWLDENKTIEADMFLPIILREKAGVSDIDLTITALMDTELVKDKLTKPFQKSCSATEAHYLIPSMAVGQLKHIYVPMTLPEDEDLTDERIVMIQLKYLDAKKRTRAKTDNVSLPSVTLEESREQAFKTGTKFKKGTEPDDRLSQMSAFEYYRGERKEAWPKAKESLKIIANEDCRVVTASHVHQTRERLRNQSNITGEKDMAENLDRMKETLRQFSAITDLFFRLTGEMTADFVPAWESRVKRSEELTTPGQLNAMLSSIEREMPTVRGIFDSGNEIPFLPPDVAYEFRKIEQNIEGETRPPPTRNLPPRPSLTEIDIPKSQIRLFEGKTIHVSESLSLAKVGTKREHMEDLILRYGGRTGRANVMNKNAVLICSEEDYQNDSMAVRIAKSAQNPIVREAFFIDSILMKKFLNVKDYLFSSPR